MSGRRPVGVLRAGFRFWAGRRPRMAKGLTGSSSLAKHRCLREAAVPTTPHNPFNVKNADGQTKLESGRKQELVTPTGCRFHLYADPA